MTSTYLAKLRTFYEDIERAVQRETDPRHRAILENYFRHVTLEGTEHWPAIFDIDPPMLAPNPVYRTNIYGHFVVDEGVEAVFRHYANGTANLPVVIVDHVMWVNDWGVASHSRFVRFLTGAEAIAQGMDADDPDGRYVQTFPLGMFWPYDENALLLGEDVYQLEPAQLTPIDASEVVTVEQRTEVVLPYLLSWFDPASASAKV